MKLSQKQITNFRRVLYEYYESHKRELMWRRSEPGGQFDPYKILVSEIMLQQTQASRVTPKYEDFLKTFPTLESLAAAPLGEVLTLWTGLGYNRRAKYLHEAAAQLRGTKRPWTEEQLVACRGIGVNTARAVIVYSYNQPEVFIETNVRTVLIHHFFARAEKIQDKVLYEVLDRVLDRDSPRKFYWALMDYGTLLKKTAGNAAQRSAVYQKQSAFVGSKRQLRGAVIRLLAIKSETPQSLHQKMQDPRLDQVLAELLVEGLITKDKIYYKLP